MKKVEKKKINNKLQLASKRLDKSNRFVIYEDRPRQTDLSILENHSSRELSREERLVEVHDSFVLEAKPKFKTIHSVREPQLTQKVELKIIPEKITKPKYEILEEIQSPIYLKSDNITLKKRNKSFISIEEILPEPDQQTINCLMIEDPLSSYPSTKYVEYSGGVNKSSNYKKYSDLTHILILKIFINPHKVDFVD